MAGKLLEFNTYVSKYFYLLIAHRCWESVTYTTHADYTFMENLEPLLDRWKGPISLALHAPGTDFETTLRTIHYLRDCSPQPISQLVTFHIYFPSKHLPKMVPKSDKLFLDRLVPQLFIYIFVYDLYFVDPYVPVIFILTYCYFQI